MERGSITKWLVLGLAVFLIMTLGKQFFGPSSSNEAQVALIRDNTAPPAETRPPEQLCKLEGPSFRAELSTRGASLRHFVLSEPRFAMDMVTTSREWRAPLRTDLRNPLGDASKAQVPYDDLDWQLQENDGKSCIFTYKDANTELKKTVAVTDKPYELAVEMVVKNLAAEPKKHRFSIEQTSWRGKKEVEAGFLQAQSPLVSETVAVTSAKTERQGPSDFDHGEQKKPEFTAEKWRRSPGEGKLAAVSTVFFSEFVAPITGVGAPAAETHIEHWWDTSRYANAEAANKHDDPFVGYLYRARIAYPEAELAPGQIATYKALAFAGPKERDKLAAVGHNAHEVLNLGTFATIASWLVKYLYVLYGFTKSWGVAIMLLTITVRLVLFPLSISQIKSSMAMRRLKPEMDIINEKYKDDAAQRGLAIQELWRKNNVSNPVIGCLPMLLQMPVWWALYTALQTAVELYHVPFLWFRDLTAPDKFFIIPIVLGASSYVQQKLMPAQGDPQQQKMMLYMMPAVFTFMMLFLPAGLGVYMLTNSVLAIVQQLLVERYLATHGGGAPTGQIEVREKVSGDDDKPPPALGKGKARARG